MELRAPPLWLFALSLTIFAVAFICSMTDIWFMGIQGSWIAILAYAVLVLGNVVKITPTS